MTRFGFIRRAMTAELGWPRKALGTIALVTASTGLRFLLGQSANPVPFVTYFPAIMVAAIFLGWRWAAVATIASAAVVNRVFLAQPWLQQSHTADYAVLVFFGFSCTILIVIGETLRRTVREMELLSRERDLLSDELYHRVQNVLSIVAALVQMGRSDSVEEFRADLTGRIHALSRANRVLQDKVSAVEDVREIIAQAVAPFDRGGTIIVEGPGRSLSQDAGYQLILLLHEMCTNALKHGALSAETGQVRISWTGDQGPLRMEWREAGGPPVSPPTRKGLGSKLLAGQNLFAVDVKYHCDGVVASITLAQA